MQTVAQFEIKYLQILNEQSELVAPLPDFANDSAILALYRHMALTRMVDNKAVNLQRTGKMGTYPAARGQEAVGTGMGFAMEKNDIFCPYYRDQAAMLLRGVSIAEIFSIWGGDERGNNYQNPKAKEDFPICVPIGCQLLHAAGMAYAVKYRQEQRAVLTICGDGGTSKGDFYEALNLAGDWQLPIVFVINNNQWAISVPRKIQTHCLTLAQKAIAAGIEGLQIDGNDVLVVQDTISKALKKAREGGGPTLIEALTYRLCDHTTADDAKRYQPHEELKDAWKKEPIARLGYFLEKKGLWSREQEQVLQQELNEIVEQAVKEYEAKSKPLITDMFDYLYKNMPLTLAQQRESVLGEKA